MRQGRLVTGVVLRFDGEGVGAEGRCVQRRAVGDRALAGADAAGAILAGVARVDDLTLGDVLALARRRDRDRRRFCVAGDVRCGRPGGGVAGLVGRGDGHRVFAFFFVGVRDRGAFRGLAVAEVPLDARQRRPVAAGLRGERQRLGGVAVRRDLHRAERRAGVEGGRCLFVVRVSGADFLAVGLVPGRQGAAARRDRYRGVDPCGVGPFGLRCPFRAAGGVVGDVGLTPVRPEGQRHVAARIGRDRGRGAGRVDESCDRLGRPPRGRARRQLAGHELRGAEPSWAPDRGELPGRVDRHLRVGAVGVAVSFRLQRGRRRPRRRPRRDAVADRDFIGGGVLVRFARVAFVNPDHGGASGVGHRGSRILEVVLRCFAFIDGTERVDDVRSAPREFVCAARDDVQRRAFSFFRAQDVGDQRVAVGVDGERRGADAGGFVFVHARGRQVPSAGRAADRVHPG